MIRVACLCPYQAVSRFIAVLGFLVTGCAVSSPQFALHGPVPPPEDRDAFAAALFQTTGARLVGGHRWHLEDSGTVFDGIIDAIEHAERSINFESYIWHSGEPSERIL